MGKPFSEKRRDTITRANIKAARRGTDEHPGLTVQQMRFFFSVDSTYIHCGETKVSTNERRSDRFNKLR